HHPIGRPHPGLRAGSPGVRRPRRERRTVTPVASLLERLAPTPGEGVRADRGRAWLDAHGLPDRRAEAWRYTPIDDIVALLDTVGPAPDRRGSIDRAAVDELAGDHGGPRLVVVNGLV